MIFTKQLISSCDSWVHVSRTPFPPLNIRNRSNRTSNNNQTCQQEKKKKKKKFRNTHTHTHTHKRGTTPNILGAMEEKKSSKFFILNIKSIYVLSTIVNIRHQWWDTFFRSFFSIYISLSVFIFLPTWFYELYKFIRFNLFNRSFFPLRFRLKSM